MFSSARRTTGSCNFLVERLHSQRPRNSHFGPLDPDPAAIELRSADFSPPASGLVPRSINTTTFAARDFWPRRGASDEHTLQRSVRSEQRRLGQKEPPPGGLRRFSVLASLLLGHRPTAGDAPSSRLARTENRRNKRGRIYGTGYLVKASHPDPDSVELRSADFSPPAAGSRKSAGSGL